MPSPASPRARIRYSAGLYRRPSRRYLLRRTCAARPLGSQLRGDFHRSHARDLSAPALCGMRMADYSSPSTLMRSMLARSTPAKNPQHWFYTFEISPLIINFIRTLPTFIRTCADECGNPIPEGRIGRPREIGGRHVRKEQKEREGLRKGGPEGLRKAHEARAGHGPEDAGAQGLVQGRSRGSWAGRPRR